MAPILTLIFILLPLVKAADEEGDTTLDEASSSSNNILPFNHINCQEGTESPVEAIERQEQESRNVEKGAVGLEIAQGAVEITLGAIRIAAAGTTADVLRREDNIANSRASLGTGGGGELTLPPDILGPILRDDPHAKKKHLCAIKATRHPQSIADDPFRRWNQGFTNRIKRSVGFADAFQSHAHLLPPTPTPDPRKATIPVNIPSLDEAEKLLKLLEDLLDTNNRVLRLLGIDLPPITSSGAYILRQYKERVYRRKQARKRYAMQGYPDEETDAWEMERNNLYSMRANSNNPHWLHATIDREEAIRLFNDELTRLKRIRRVRA